MAKNDYGNNDELFVDVNGKTINKGDRVVWYDPELRARDLSRVWDVYDMGGDIVYIADEHGEAEVYANELEVI